MASSGLNPATEHWFYNTESGALNRATNGAELGLEFDMAVGKGAGWHELNISGNATEAQAAAEAKREFPTGKAPTSSITQALKNEGGAGGVIGGAATAVSDAGAVSNFLGDLTQRNTYLRVIKVLVGAGLLLVGVSHLTGMDNAIGRVARRVPAPF